MQWAPAPTAVLIVALELEYWFSLIASPRRWLFPMSCYLFRGWFWCFCCRAPTPGHTSYSRSLDPLFFLDSSGRFPLSAVTVWKSSLRAVCSWFWCTIKSAWTVLGSKRVSSLNNCIGAGEWNFTYLTWRTPVSLSSSAATGTRQPGFYKIHNGNMDAPEEGGVAAQPAMNENHSTARTTSFSSPFLVSIKPLLSSSALFSPSKTSWASIWYRPMLETCQGRCLGRGEGIHSACPGSLINQRPRVCACVPFSFLFDMAFWDRRASVGVLDASCVIQIMNMYWVVWVVAAGRPIMMRVVGGGSDCFWYRWSRIIILVMIQGTSVSAVVIRRFSSLF